MVENVESSGRARSAEEQRRITERVRVRLLVVFPLLIVLLLSIVAGVLYQIVEAEFGFPTPRPSEALTEQRLGEVARTWILAMIAFDLGGAILGYAIAYSITAPIRRLIDVSRQIASGDLQERAAIRRPDDLGALSHSFDTMVESLNRFIEHRNRFILESFTGGLLTLDTHGTVTALNSAAERLLGLRASQAVGHPVEEVLGSGKFEILLHAVRETLWENKPLRSRRLPVRDEKGDIRWLSVNASPMVEKDGAPFGVIVNIRDLEEWERFHRELARTDQLATLGTFAAGLAHELRNPLGAIRGLAQLLAEEAELPARCHEYCRVIMRECERLDGLVREIYDFAQPQAVTRDPVDVNELVRRALMLARNNQRCPLPPEVTVVEEFTALPLTRGNEEKLEQALLNLLTNAIEATPAGGEIRLRTRLRPNELLPIEIEIENTGSSLPPDSEARVFEPFFTTKEGGTGLGLAIAHQIVAAHGGSLRIANSHEGVTVQIRLPADDGAPSSETSTPEGGC